MKIIEENNEEEIKCPDCGYVVDIEDIICPICDRNIAVYEETV